MQSTSWLLELLRCEICTILIARPVINRSMLLSSFFSTTLSCFLVCIPDSIDYLLLLTLGANVQYLVCVFVCLSAQCLFSPYRLQGGLCHNELYKRVQIYEGLKGDSLEMTAFGRYGVKTSKKANMHDQHWLTSTTFCQIHASWRNQ